MARSMILCFMIGLCGWGYDIEGVVFSDSVTSQTEQGMDLYSAGLLKYRVIFNGYAVALYLPSLENADPLDDISKQMTFHYFWDIKGRAFAEKAEEVLKKAITKQNYEKLEPKVAQFHRFYVNIKEGDRYQLRYAPGNGTQLLHNGELLGTVNGKEFAKAYFGIWLGEEPISKSLKKQLLTRIEG